MNISTVISGGQHGPHKWHLGTPSVREREREREGGGERTGTFCEVWIRVVSVPAALESVKDAVILVE